MGLDIFYYKNVSPAQGDEAFDEEGELKEDWHQFHVSRQFPGRADEIKHDHPYFSEDYNHFQAGRYSGYNRFRNQLAELAGYPKIKTDVRGGVEERCDAFVWQNPGPGPFMELIDFSDFEGVIGAAVSAKLAKDFRDFQDKADEHPDELFRKKFSKWRTAFEFASENGVVEFS